MTIFRQRKLAMTQQPSVDTLLGAVCPTMIGNHYDSEVDEGNDNWSEVEGSLPLQWRSCKGCAFLCAAHEPACKVCGTPNQVQKEDEHIRESVADGLSPHEGYPVVQMQILEKAQKPSDTEVANESTDACSDDDEEFESDSEGELIPGTLDVAPQAGTLVKVLYDDDQWHLAKVLAARGSQARVCFESGRRVVLDFDLVAVRLAEYDSDDDGSEASEDLDSGDEGEEEPEAAQVKGADNDSDSEEEEFPGTLDEAPTQGTMVEIMYEDECWYAARVIASHGTKAIVRRGDHEEEVDFEIHAVRLTDVVGEDEASGHEDAFVVTECVGEHIVQVNKAKEEGSEDKGAASGEMDSEVVDRLIMLQVTCIGQHRRTK